MSTTVERETVEFADNGDSEFAKGRGPIDWLGGWASLFWGSALISATFIGLRIYQQQFAWWNEAGLDSSSSAFRTYWFSLFIGELVVAAVVTLGWWGWLLKSGQKLDAAAQVKAITPA
jgi:methane/ammonia monooxygenase subunit C